MKLIKNEAGRLFQIHMIEIPSHQIDNAHCICDNENIQLIKNISKHSLKIKYSLYCENCGRSTDSHINIDDVFYQWMLDIQYSMLGHIH